MFRFCHFLIQKVKCEILVRYLSPKIQHVQRSLINREALWISAILDISKIQMKPILENNHKMGLPDTNNSLLQLG